MQSGIPISNLFAAEATLACAIAVCLIACDGNERTAENGRAQDAAHATSHLPASPDPRRSADADLASIRDRADAAFAALEPSRSQGKSRVGPRPWPDDLPVAWPAAAAGQVLADTRRDGDRLLLVDVPGERDAALERYAEDLRAGGFHVEAGRHGGTPSLRAQAGDAEAELTFYARESGGKPVTRVEILFPGRAAG